MNMQKGKYLSAKRTGRTKKKPIILIVSLVLLFVAAVGGTVAYLYTTSGSTTNTFTPANVPITPTEETTADSKSDIQFQNTGNVDVYIRATLTIYWKDSAGNIVPQPAGGKIEGGNISSGWTAGENGIYYYDFRVAPGDWTSIMLSDITVTCPDGYTCHIDVHAESIQADGMGATSAQDAWKKAKGGLG